MVSVERNLVANELTYDRLYLRELQEWKNDYQLCKLHKKLKSSIDIVKCVTKYQYQFDALYGHFVELQFDSSARGQNVGNPVTIQ